MPVQPDHDSPHTGLRVLVAFSLLLALSVLPGAASAQRSFDRPEDAFAALGAALAADDKQAIVEIFGEEYESRIVTADWDAERPARDRIAAAAAEKQELRKVSDAKIEWVLGDEAWPFPIGVVRNDAGSWQFDTQRGIEAVLDRRIGRNELAAIAILDAYVDAQIEYAKADRDGDEVFEYAERLASTKGKRDGLYWEPAEGEPESPFGPLVEGAESYLDTVAKGDPIRGYYFRVLKRQGENPPGGAYDYVINGNMIAGFALVAYPADYGNTGVMTFVVNHRGVIEQADLGAFEGMDAYDPDDSWTKAEVQNAP